MSAVHSAEDLQRIYSTRFGENRDYRTEVWKVLVRDFFSRYVQPTDAVLDLGCGYGEFINAVSCREKFAMDMNKDTPQFLAPELKFLAQDCSVRWPLSNGSLDVVFTSNFFEHLPDKVALGRTLDEIRRCLRSGGRLVAIGPNIKYLAGHYWDFWDHHIALTEGSLKVALVTRGFGVELCLGKFLPYTMASGRRYPLRLLQAYLRLPLAWQIFGGQFLVIAVRT